MTKITKFFLLLTLIFLAGFFPIHKDFFHFPDIRIFAANLLTNPSFTGGSTGWTLSSSTYDASYYQNSIGSLKTVASGKNTAVTGTAEQTLGTSIEAGSTVRLTLYWSKMCVTSVCKTNTIRTEIALPSAPTTWVAIWEDTSTPAVGSTTAWTGPSSLDVSSYFTESGTYKIRTYANLANGANSANQSVAWFDNLNLDVIAPNITVSSTGTQVASINIGNTQNYLGGAFTVIRSGNTADITQIVVSETGSINANSNLSNLTLYYESAPTCAFDNNETLFGTAAGFNSSEKAVVTGSMIVGPSQICIYPVVDVGSSASSSQTINIGISNPSSDITVSSGTVSPSTNIDIGGTTSLVLQAVVSISLTSDGSISYGPMLAGANRSTLDMIPHDTQIVRNDSNIPVNFNIKGQNTLCPWVLGSSYGSEQYVHKFSTNAGSLWTPLSTTYQTLTSNVAVGATVPFDLQIFTPTFTTCYSQQNADISIQAVAP
ncbi:MAG TPA: hypothetical protein VF828_02840 [Patescibacteria group bacterium]